jgi:Flavin containing amine oxidoreductase
VPQITVVGGGLAGMAAALRLLERGCKVTLFESSDRLGGKAGANRQGKDFDEHAYHIFPAWYLNVWKIVSELGIRDNFTDRSDIVLLKRGEFPDRIYVYHNITSWRSGLRNLFAGFIPPSEMFLFNYAVCDLLSQPYSRRSFLDQISVSGFVRSKVYRCRDVELQFEELILKGLSVPTYEVSSMTMAQVMSVWVYSPLPLMRILTGNLQEFFIEPLRRRIEELGGVIHLGSRLINVRIEEGRVADLEFSTQGNPEPIEHPIDPKDECVVMAIPCDKFAPLIDDQIYRASRNLGEIKQLRAAPLAAFNIYLNRRVPGIPKPHVLLAESKFALSFIDVSQAWQGFDKTVLNCMASNFAPLVGLTPEVAFAELLDDLRDFIPTIDRNDIERIELQTHTDEPLFMNSVGAWAFRPSESNRPHLRTKNAKQIPNLYLAGDYCRSAIDLVSMEGAVSTGLLAAEAIRKELDLPSPIQILEPRRAPVWIWWIIKVLLWPVAAVLGLLVRLRESSQSSGT